MPATYSHFKLANDTGYRGGPSLCACAVLLIVARENGPVGGAVVAAFDPLPADEARGKSRLAKGHLEVEGGEGRLIRGGHNLEDVGETCYWQQNKLHLLRSFFSLQKSDINRIFCFLSQRKLMSLW